MTAPRTRGRASELAGLEPWIRVLVAAERAPAGLRPGANHAQHAAARARVHLPVLHLPVLQVQPAELPAPAAPRQGQRPRVARAPKPPAAAPAKKSRKAVQLVEGERLRVPGLAPPPATRGACGAITRPCPAACRLSTAIVEEHPGRPWPSTPLKPPRVRPGPALCALDFTEQFPDGAPPDVVARELGESVARTLQVENRALLKAKVARQLIDHLEDLRSQLPARAELVVAVPASLDSLAVHVHVSIRVPSMVGTAETGLPLRRRRGHEPKTTRRKPEGGPDGR